MIFSKISLDEKNRNLFFDDIGRCFSTRGKKPAAL